MVYTQMAVDIRLDRIRVVLRRIHEQLSSHNDILRGLWRRKPDLNVVRVQEAGLSGADDRASLFSILRILA